MAAYRITQRPKDSETNTWGPQEGTSPADALRQRLQSLKFNEVASGKPIKRGFVMVSEEPTQATAHTHHSVWTASLS